jgi:hypothetical protein
VRDDKASGERVLAESFRPIEERAGWVREQLFHARNEDRLRCANSWSRTNVRQQSGLLEVVGKPNPTFASAQPVACNRGVPEAECPVTSGQLVLGLWPCAITRMPYCRRGEWASSRLRDYLTGTVITVPGAELTFANASKMLTTENASLLSKSS